MHLADRRPDLLQIGMSRRVVHALVEFQLLHGRKANFPEYCSILDQFPTKEWGSASKAMDQLEQMTNAIR